MLFDVKFEGGHATVTEAETLSKAIVMATAFADIKEIPNKIVSIKDDGGREYYDIVLTTHYKMKI